MSFKHKGRFGKHKEESRLFAQHIVHFLGTTQNIQEKLATIQYRTSGILTSCFTNR